MRVSSSTAILHSYTKHPAAFALEDIPAMLRTAGFEGIDWSLWDFCLDGAMRWSGFITEPGWEESVSHLRDADEKAGIVCFQTHGVAVNAKTYRTMEPSVLQEMERRCLTASAMLGASWMVIHPFSIYEGDRAASIRFFREHLKPLQELAHRHEVGIAIENMILRAGMSARFCSGADELAELLAEINDPLVGCCWDTGHAHLSGQAQGASIRLLGKSLKALHIDDNVGQSMDLHLLPYEGHVAWEEVLQALRDIGYDYEFAFEHAVRPLPHETLPSQLAFMSSLGHAMIRA